MGMGLCPTRASRSREPRYDNNNHHHHHDKKAWSEGRGGGGLAKKEYETWTGLENSLERL